MDKIKIENLEIFANHGVFPEETRLGQKFLVTAELYLDTRKAGLTDDLDASINYGTVCHIIKKEMEEKTFRLIEAVAENLCRVILRLDKRICQVDIEVKKPWAPIGLPLEAASVWVSRKRHEVYVAVGSNMGDKKAYIANAFSALKCTQDCEIVKTSELLVTEPYGGVEQDEFLNGVWKVETLLTAREFLERLHEIEQEAGRERLIHWGPRTLDLDILFYDDEIIQEDDLCIPHVDIRNRDFVLLPMVEIAPYKRHPVYGKTMKEMLDEWKAKSKNE